MNRDLVASYNWCWQTVRGSGSSFYRSFYLLSQPTRNSMAALYAFARVTDDFGDGHFPNAYKAQLLAHWRSRLAEKLNASDQRHLSWEECCGSEKMDRMCEDRLAQFDSLWPALVDTVQRYSIPSEWLFDVIKGIELDIGQVRVADWDELTQYCYYVASAVGLSCTRLWEARETLPRQAAIDCGMAFQLTNILRDVREDAARGRIYIPRSELVCFGCHEAAWLNGRPDGDWTGCVDAMVQRASELYASGWLTGEHLNDEGRRMFSLMWRTYRNLLDRVHGAKGELWKKSPVRVSRSTKLRLAASHFLPQWYRKLPDPLGNLHVKLEQSSAT